MSTHQYRLALVILNITLVLAIGYLGYRTYAGSKPSKAETLPDFNPLAYALDEAQTKKGAKLQEMAVVWRELDRPKQRRTVITTPVKRQPVRPRPQDLSRIFTLVMANYNDKDPKKSTVILEDRNRRKQITLSVGEKFSGYEVLDISISGEGDERMASVTITHRGSRHTIQLKRKPGR